MIPALITKRSASTTCYRPPMALVDDLRVCLQELPHVRLAVLFGSAARGELGPDSDVDIAISLDTDTYEARVQVEAALGRAARRELDYVDLDRAAALLRFEVARDGVLLVERQPYAFADFRARAMLDWWDWMPYARRIEAAALTRLAEQVTRGSR